MLPTPRVEHYGKELMAAIRLMQSSSNELNTLVSGKAKCKQQKLLHNALQFSS